MASGSRFVKRTIRGRSEMKDPRETIARPLHWRGEGRKVEWDDQNENVRDWYLEWADEIVAALAEGGWTICGERVARQCTGCGALSFDEHSSHVHVSYAPIEWVPVYRGAVRP
jgi:hypothetical protein